MINRTIFGRLIAIGSILTASCVMPIGTKKIHQTKKYIESFKPIPCAKDHPKQVGRLGSWHIYTRDIIYIAVALLSALITFIITTFYHAKKFGNVQNI